MDKQKNVPFGDPQMPYVVQQEQSSSTLFKVIIGCVVLLIVLCCVVPLIFGAVTLALINVAQDNEISSTEVQQIPITTEQVTLVVDHNIGDTVVRGADDVEEIEVRITRKARALTEGRAEELLDSAEISLRQSDGRYVIDTTRDEGFFMWQIFQNVDIELTITVPRRLNVEIAADVGAVRIRDVEIVDRLDLENNVGSIEFDGVLGPEGRHNITNNVGDITVIVREGSAFDLDARTNVGEIDVDLTEGRQGIRSSSEGPAQQITGTYSTLSGGDEPNARLTIRNDVGAISIRD